MKSNAICQDAIVKPTIIKALLVYSDVFPELTPILTEATIDKESTRTRLSAEKKTKKKTIFSV